MAKRRLAMFSHLPEEVQKMYELEDDEEVFNFVDHFAEGGPVVLVKKKRISEEEKRKNLEKIYDVCSEILWEKAMEEEKRLRAATEAT